MAATLCSPTGYELITWAGGTDPATQDITIPSDCTAVYMFWTYWLNNASYGLSTVTLEAVSPDEQEDTPTGSNQKVACGVAAWYNPTTGAGQTVDVTWDQTPGQGPTTIMVYVKGGDTTGWRDVGSQSTESADACSVTLTTQSGDLVVAVDQRYNGLPPDAGGSWVNIATDDNNSEFIKARYISATGSTQACDCENESSSSMVAVAIGPAAAGAVFVAPRNPQLNRRHTGRFV